MIALPTDMPFIRIGGSSLAICEAAWLTKTLTDAADGTDLPSWLAVDISRGVETYLTTKFTGTVIDSDELFNQIINTLSKLGLSHVASNIDKTPPPLRISLTELARRAGTGYELAFFNLLENEFHSAAIGGANKVECHGLQNCVRRLSSAKKWSRRCDNLRNEIEHFLDYKAQQSSPDCPKMSVNICH